MAALIRFRGKSVETDEWIYGEHVVNESGIHINGNIHSPSNPDRDGKSTKGKVNPTTVDQFIGMTDRKGNFIYEGDIIRVYKNGRIYGTPDWVMYRAPSFILYNTMSSELLTKCENLSSGFTCEVIGNIYEHENLLK